VSSPKARRPYRRGSHLYQRGGWFYAYTAERPKGTALRTRDRLEAERRFRELLTAVGKPELGGRPKEHPLTVLVGAFLEAPHGYTRRSLRSFRNRLLAWGEWMGAHGATLPSEVTSELMDAWMSERMKAVARSTMNRDLRCVRVLLRWAAERGYAARAVAVLERRDIREPSRPRRHVVPDPAEMRRVLDAVARRHEGAARALATVYGTGMRADELRRLTAFDVRADGVHVRPEGGAAELADPTKGYAERVVPVHEEVLKIARTWIAWQSGAKARTGGRCSERWLLDWLRRGCADAGVERCTPHDLRRAFATGAVRAGVELVIVSRWLGHRLVSTTERYIADYRSDAAVRAPLPAALADCLRIPAVHAGPSLSTRAVRETSRRRSKRQ